MFSFIVSIIKKTRIYFSKSIKKKFGTDLNIILLVFVTSSLFFGLFLMYSEENLSFHDTIYYLVTTVLTVGYGDISPTTITGKYFAIFYMLSGISTMAVLIGAFANKLVDVSNTKKKGYKKMKKDVDLLIIGYPSEDKVKSLVHELSIDNSFLDSNIILLNNILDEEPYWFNEIKNIKLSFIKGYGSDEEALMRANINQTKKALILANDAESIESDDYTTSTVSVIELLNSDVYTIVEKVRKSNILFETLPCDMYIDVTNSHVLAQEIIDEGAIELQKVIFSNDISGTQFNIELSYNDISKIVNKVPITWGDIAMKFISMNCIPEGYKYANEIKFNLMPDINDVILSNNKNIVVKYRSNKRLKDI